MEKNPDPGSGMKIPDHFSESLETVSRAKNTQMLRRGSGTWDPGWLSVSLSAVSSADILVNWTF
jgi:hypothetical protein